MHLWEALAIKVQLVLEIKANKPGLLLGTEKSQVKF